MVLKNPLFEISWEVCNKVGGIHTVILSKLKFVCENFSNYFVIGPYRGKSQTEFIESSQQEIPENLNNIFQELKKIGIIVHYGKWDVEEEPTALLIEYMNYSKNINDIKGKIWDVGGVDSLDSDWYDFDEVMLWSWCAGIVIEKISSLYDEKTIVHSHEWMAGGSIFYIKNIQKTSLDFQNKFRTIFTTHATMLGRALSGSGENLYEIKDKINPDEKAIEVGVKTKHQTEKALANISDAFSTVSKITANEAEIFYKKKADFLLYNGFDNTTLGNIENFYFLYENSRKQIDTFLYNYFKRFYNINLDNSQIIFTSGRNEFRTKGIDIFTQSLSKLNDKLKNENSSKNIIAMYLIPIGEFGKDETLIKSINDKNYLRQVDLDFASLSTHYLGWDNQYIKTLIENNLKNHKTDKVKVILVPTYLDGKDDFINMNYYDVILGMDLGVFASYYEPWGYTPLECISYGIPTITTNLAGFGKTVALDYKKNEAITVLDRETKSDEQIVVDLTDELYNFTIKTPKELFNQKKQSREFSKNFSWSKFYQNYLDAYKFILEK